MHHHRSRDQLILKATNINYVGNIYMYVCFFIYVQIYMQVYIYNICLYVNIVYVCICICVCILICICICVYINVYVCIYIYVVYHCWSESRGPMSFMDGYRRIHHCKSNSKKILLDFCEWSGAGFRLEGSALLLFQWRVFH